MIGNPTPWWGRAKCVGQDTEDFFFPESTTRKKWPDETEKARDLCFGCPVVSECLTDALSQGPERQHGVAGATTAGERARLFVVTGKTVRRRAAA